MSANQARFRIATMARVLGVSTSGYDAWRRRPPSARAQADADLTARVQAIHTRSRGTYGAPRVHAELAEAGVAVSRKRVARVMRAAGMAGVSRRRGPRTTHRDSPARPAPDLVERRFEAEAPNRLWVADITYVPTLAGFLYLAIVLDVFSRRVVGWAMAEHLRTALVLEALEMAVAQRRPDYDDVDHPATATRIAMRSLARRILELNNEIADLDDLIEPLVIELGARLLERPCIGIETAGQLLVTAGDNPGRVRSEAAWAMLCGVAPLPASSGKTDRHRLNRGGDRQANRALHMIAISRLRTDERTRAFAQRKLASGKSKLDAIRCIKRYIAREGRCPARC